MRIFLSLVIVVASAALADAGPLRRGRAAPAASCSGPSCPVVNPVQGVHSYNPYQFASAQSPPGLVCVGGSCPATLPASVVVGEPPLAAVPGGDDALAEVNALRAARGLRPYLRDEGLTQAARACAAHRAANRLFGHSANDFQFVPPGVSASAAGCAAYPPGYGWLSCCVYDGYTFAGAAWVMGADGKRYMHLFCR